MFTFGGTEGSMLGRRGWFNAVSKRFDTGKKGMVQCCDKNNGSMLNRKKGLMQANLKKIKYLNIFHLIPIIFHINFPIMLIVTITLIMSC